jgi:hypothetical protein
MNESGFDKIRFADSQVTKLSYEDTNVTVYYKDWQENSHTLIFGEVLWFEVLYPIGQDLRHGLELKKHPVIEEICRKVGESISRPRFICSRFC